MNLYNFKVLRLSINDDSDMKQNFTEKKIVHVTNIHITTYRNIHT